MPLNYLYTIITVVFLIHSSDAMEPSSYPPLDSQFLGTLAGKPNYVKSFEKGEEYTYGRVLCSELVNDLRRAISRSGHDEFGKGYKIIGEDYSYTPWYYGSPFSHRQTSMPGGGFFLTTKTLEQPKNHLNCFAYALGSFGSQLEELSGLPMCDIQKLVSMTPDDIVSRYFDCVKGDPKDGDLVIYQTTKPIVTLGGQLIPAFQNTHAGIYRESEKNWNSPLGGTVESKWGWLSNPYVFQHDVFFVPHFYGDLVKFYRIKKLPQGNIRPSMDDTTFQSLSQ